MLAHVAEARQPPTFVASKPAGGPSSYAPATRARPRAGSWQEGEVRTGDGPIGTIHPGSGGMIIWGRLRGGGYLCRLPASGQPKEWPVVILDESLRFSVTHHMSAARFLLELATRPERVALPPHIDQRR